MVKIVLRSSAKQDLKRMGRDLRRMLLHACMDVCDDWTIGKQLKSPLQKFRSHRVGEYRILYRVQTGSEVDIIAIGHRSFKSLSPENGQVTTKKLGT